MSNTNEPLREYVIETITRGGGSPDKRLVTATVYGLGYADRPKDTITFTWDTEVRGEPRIHQRIWLDIKQAKYTEDFVFEIEAFMGIENQNKTILISREALTTVAQRHILISRDHLNELLSRW